MEIGYDEEINFDYDRGLTISTGGNPSWKDVFSLIHKAIIKVEKRTGIRNKLRALMIGENKHGSSRSRVWHLEFSRLLTKEEREEIEHIAIRRNAIFPKPNAGILIFWGIENNGNTKNYVLVNPKHTYFKKVIVRGE